MAAIDPWEGQVERSRVEASFRAHYPDILAFAIRRQPDRQAAEDAAAETFAVAWRRRDSMPDLPLPWLYGIALRVLANQRRARSRRRRLEERAATDRTVPTSVDDAVEAIDRRRLFQAAFTRLAEDDKEVLRLIAWEGLRPARGGPRSRLLRRSLPSPFAPGPTTPAETTRRCRTFSRRAPRAGRRVDRGMTMSSHARTPDPLGLMRVCDPVDAVALRAELAATEIEEAIARAIGRADCQGELDPPGDAFAAAPIPSRRSASRPLALAGALVALIAAVLLLTGAFSGAGSHPTYAAAAVKVAEANPRLLVTAPGWKVTDANEFEIGNGEMTFADGTRKLSLTWYPARLYRSYLRDRASVSEPRSSRLLGHAATTVDYGRGEYATMLSPFGAVFVELRGRLGGRSAYRSVLASLRPVDVDTWLGAMPPSVVAPEAQPRTVRRMLRGIPLPPNFHPIGLTGESTVLDHYSLGVKVADAVACGWVEAWLAARGSPVR